MGAPVTLTAKQLQSPRHADVAMALSDALVGLVETLPEHGGAPVADALRQAREVVWQDGEDRDAAYAAVAESLPSAKDRRLFFEAYARMGQLYELAGLIARENVIRFELDDVAPGGIHAFVKQAPSVDAAVDALNQPVFEMVMTAHPTNVISQSSIRQQRDLGAAVDAVRMQNANPAVAIAALKSFLTTPIIEQDGGGLHNLSVQEETELALYYLHNLYEDLPQAFRSIDGALAGKAAEEGTKYNPLAFKPQVRFGSWGSSGDKDGNANVNADTTLDAMAAHTHAILKHYAQDLAQRPYVELKPWKDRIDQALAETSGVLSDIRKTMKRQGSLAPEQFDAFAGKLTHATRLLDAKGFARAAHSTFVATRDVNMLDLVRRIDTFGFHFSKIEYRENALEYGRAVGALIPDYDAKSPAEKETLLTELLQDPAKLAAVKDAAWPTIVAEGAGKAYDEANAAPIAYQTIRRMELARDFPGMVKDNVLAEFEQPHQLLEALLLQRVATKGGKAPSLGVIPLFESPESMQAAPEIMAKAYANPAYAAHLVQHGNTQQIQIAHSDNARRSGLPAARAFIYDAHRTLRAASEKAGVSVQFFEGGSSSDVFRGGVRAVSTAVQNYGLHDFAKFTYQGGDLLNYLNYQPSTKRLFIRNLSNAAAHFVAADAAPWQDRVQGKGSDATQNELADQLAIAALKATLTDYQQHAFTREGLGHLLKELEYDEEKLAGTAGSRAPQRVGFAKVASVQRAEAEPQTVDIFKTRTITFSEALQHGGLVPTMVGGRTIYENLRGAMNAARADIQQRGAATAAERQFLGLFGRDARADAPLPAKAIQFEFAHSPLFRDVVVRMVIGVAMTDFDQIRTHHPRLKNDPFLEQLEAEYREAASLCVASITGEYPERHFGKRAGIDSFNAIPTADLRTLVSGLLPEIEQVVSDKARYLDVVQFLKADARQQGDLPDDYTRRLMHAAGDTVMHGRILPVDDPALGLHQRRQHEAASAKQASAVSR